MLKPGETKRNSKKVLFQATVEVQFVNFIWWFAFVLDGVLSDRSDTMCQIGGIRIESDNERKCKSIFLRQYTVH
jgi:hypothetical protein